MASLFKLAHTSVLDASSNNSMQHVLESSTPGLGYLQNLLRTWLNLDLATAAAVLTIIGVISGAAQDLSGVALKAYWWITKWFTASISIAGSDRLNREVLNWLGANILVRQKTRILTAGTEKVDTDAWHYRRITLERDDYRHEKRVPITYLPTFGVIWFVYERNIFLVKRIQNSRSVLSGPYSHMPEEYVAAPDGSEPLVVMCLGLSVVPIKRFLEACRLFAEKQREDFVTIRSSKSPDHYYDVHWDTVVLRPVRPLETVHFDEAAKAALVADIENYLDKDTRCFYTTRGIPYRRGYLLHGPPGTGKTSLSLALAGLFGLELYMLHIPSVHDDNHMERLFGALPPRCIVLLEDIDAVGIEKRSHAGSGDGESDDDGDDEEQQRRLAAGRRSSSRCTLSGLLNVLDGVSSQEGRIVLMTSNFADRLDRALIRPGRVDRIIYLGNVSPRSAELMFLRMYARASGRSCGPAPAPAREAEAAAGKATAGKAATEKGPLSDGEGLAALAAEFGRGVPDNTLSPAQLQGYLLSHRDAPAMALAGLGRWVAEEKARADEAESRARMEKERVKRRRRECKLRNLAKALTDHADVVSGIERQDALAAKNGKQGVGGTESGAPNGREKEANGTAVTSGVVSTEKVNGIKAS